MSDSVVTTVQAEGICKAYNRVPVLFPLSFRLAAGQGLAVLGPNGSGKSTLLRLLSGLTTSSDGRLSVCGLALPNRRREVYLRVGMLGHDTYLYEDLTGLEHLQFWLDVAGVTTGDMALVETLARLGLERRAGDRVRTYSAGMKRRLGLARVSLLDPDLILLDEPHASLDEEGLLLVDDFVRAARRRGRTVVIASHDRARTLALCDQAMVLNAGRVTFQDTVQRLTGHPGLWVVHEGSG